MATATVTANGKPLRSKHDAACLKAIERFNAAEDSFLGLADQAADRDDDPAFHKAFAAAEAEHVKATAELWPFIYPGRQKPVSHQGTVYRPSPNRRGEQMLIEAFDVHAIN